LYGNVQALSIRGKREIDFWVAAVGWRASSSELGYKRYSNVLMVAISMPTPISLVTPLYTYQGHSSGVNAVAWSPDGKRIASGSDDKTVQVWGAG
jgi:WD40 repeat protein